ncbi:MAG: thioesterase [Bacteroidales bacterium]|nr:thioesterase [Bacteroidales bacterium]MDT8430928.1 thioesterase [Bacteroidales bacterium]
MKNTLQQAYTVSSFQVDPKGKARLTALASFLQETAYRHADSLQLGYRHLADNNSAWILSRLRIRVLEYPDWDDEVTVESWPRGIEKLFALRDFLIRNSDGKVVTEASTSWLMVDVKKRRPMRIPPDFIKIETRTDSVFDQSPGIIALPGELEVCDTRRVKYADLDVVGHVNNVKYIEWCTDAADPDLVIGQGICGFSINFISEARLGEQVEIRCSSLQKSAQPPVQKMYISGYNLDAGRECFQAVLTFPPSS